VFRNFFSKPAVAEVSPEEARAKKQSGAVIVDVREPYELREGYIPGAVHIPLRSLSPRMKELDPSKEIVVVAGAETAASPPRSSCSKEVSRR